MGIGREEDGQERGGEIRKMALTEEDGDGGGQRWRGKGRKEGKKEQSAFLNGNWVSH